MTYNRSDIVNALYQTDAYKSVYTEQRGAVVNKFFKEKFPNSHTGNGCTKILQACKDVVRKGRELSTILNIHYQKSVIDQTSHVNVPHEPDILKRRIAPQSVEDPSTFAQGVSYGIDCIESGEVPYNAYIQIGESIEEKLFSSFDFAKAIEQTYEILESRK